ncbi:PadR family transcriptional regulator [Alcaligenes faecalis]|nr:PadR family transcriptional regulator [Alcaligenes faecalis]AYZ92833.1 PadR family transcriptional regulator [Alcaligenes faecalis]QQC31363.1 helix-turn-helix transcriptional regulator [Alcaligenes faecalis]
MNMKFNTLDVERMLLDMGQGRKYSARAMQLMLMVLLKEGSTHGYQLIRRFAQLSQNSYVPSAGAVYPALAYCATQGWVLIEEEGRRKMYSLTKEGQTYLEEQKEKCDYLMQSLTYRGRKLVWIRQMLAEHNSDEDLKAAQEQTGWLPEFVQVRHSLKQAMFEQSTASLERQAEVVAVLEKAIAEIRNLPKES